MSSQDQSRRELAKSGDPKAIADAINHSLKAKGINADVMRDNGYLHVMLEGDQVPNHQKELVNFVRNGMDRLGVQTIHTVKVYGRQFGDDLPLWEEEIILRTPPPPVVEPANDIHLDESSVPLVDEEDDENYDIDNEIIDEDDIEDEDEYLPPAHHQSSSVYNPEEDDDPDDEQDETTREVEPKTPKNKVLLFSLLGGLGVLVVLAGLHLTGIFRLPFLPGGSSPTPESASAPANTTTTPPAQGSSNPTSAPATPVDPFTEAVKTATNAANLAQTAQTKADWTKVATAWQQASALMNKVPESHPKFTVAEDRAVQYANNQKVAQQKAATAPN